MKFSFATKKLKSADLNRIRGHNERAHLTASQLPQPAWFHPAGHYNVVRWDEIKATRARSLSKRKDAVVGISVAIQIGNQRDWREPTSDEFPHGKPWQPAPLDVVAFTRATWEALHKVFGADNLVSLDLHLDESTPHVQAVVVPIRHGKLQAKHWLDGKQRLAALRRDIHEVINAVCPCEYTPGSTNGGMQHDPTKAAGAATAATLADLLELQQKDPDALDELRDELRRKLRGPKTDS